MLMDAVGGTPCSDAAGREQRPKTAVTGNVAVLSAASAFGTEKGKGKGASEGSEAAATARYCCSYSICSNKGCISLFAYVTLRGSA